MTGRQPHIDALPALVSTRHEFFYMASIYLPIAIGVFVVVAAAVTFAIVRDRGREEPSRHSDNNLLEGSYAVVLACVAAFLIYLLLTSEHTVDTVANHERPSLVVDVTAAKWAWEFRLPAYGIVARSGWAVGHEPLVVPADRAIRFNLTSQDVIHSIWIPQLEFKRDLIHGTVEHVTLTFTHAGLYPAQCAEFCGVHHPEMTFSVRVLAPSAFTAWADAHRGGST